MPETNARLASVAGRTGRTAAEVQCDALPRLHEPSGPRVRVELVIHELDGELLVYDRTRGDTHRLNESANMIFRLCDGTHSQEAITRRLLERYQAGPPEVHQEVERAIQAFHRLGLLQEPGVPQP